MRRDSMSAPVQMPLLPSPFLRDPARPEVFVVPGADAYAAAREALRAIGLAPARGRRVLLKPNAGRLTAAGSGVTTNPQVVAAAIDAFVEAGATVAVGESPITGVRTPEEFEITGIAAVARERGCPLLDMDARRGRRVAVPEGRAIRTLTVCPELFDFDLVVSIPVMKTHMHTGVSLAVKNMKGCLWRRTKVDLHMLPPVAGETARSLDVAIADMSGVLRPHLALMDGSIGLEGLGPSAGRPRPLGAIVAGADAFAADAVACRLMGLDAGEVAHLRIGAGRGYGTIDLARIAVAPADWMSLAQSFARPPTSLSFEFPGVVVHDSQSCSACQSTLLLFLRQHADELREYVPAGDPVHVAIGKGHTTLPAGTLRIGNCARCPDSGGLHIPGCPPVSSAILRELKKRKPA